MTRPTIPFTRELRDQLRRRSPEQIAELLLRVPALAEALQGRGLLSGLAANGLVYAPHRAQPQPTLERLAMLLSSAVGIDMTLASLDRFSLQLVTLAAWHGGDLDRKTALAEVGADRGDDLDSAATILADLLLTEADAGWLVLRRGVAQVVGLPGTPIRTYGEALGSDALAAMARRLGVDKVPSRKMERLAAVEQRLRDPDAVHAAAAKVSADAQRAFNVLLGSGPQRVSEVGVPYYSPWGRATTTLHELEAAGLVGVNFDQQVCWVWLDVVVGLNGRLFSHWPPRAATPKTQPLRENPGLPPVLGRLAALLAHWAGEPAPALQTGGLGVRPIRAAAKALGASSGEVGLLASLAVSLGLLGRLHLGSTGRGRARTDTWAWAPTPQADEFAALAPDRQWALLVQAWRDDTSLDETQGLPERVDDSVSPRPSLLRSTLLRLLQSLPPGAGLAPDELAVVAETSASAGLRGPAVGHVVAAARVLGLVPPDGPVGLTTLGRALLDGPASLAAALPPPRTEFTVQADLSVVAPPDLAPDVTARLERYAELESATGARVYRLSERRIGAALDGGESASQILDFLAEHATAQLAQNVDYLVRDCQRRHGRLRAGGCVSYVRSDDAAALTSAVAVKAAKLRLLAPTVAVSSLPRAKVLAALRAKGLMPVAEDADGATLTTAGPEASAAAKGRSLPPLRDSLEIRRSDAEALAAKVLAAAELAPDPTTPRTGPKYVTDPRWVELDALAGDEDEDDEFSDWTGSARRGRA